MFNYLIIILIILLASVYLVSDYRGPKRISLHTGIIFNIKCLKAKELIVQEFDRNGNIWASRGLVLYLLEAGDDYFSRIAHVPVGLSFFWLNNFSLFRRYTNKPECMEATVAEEGHICAFSGGYMWYLPSGGHKFRKTMKLSHFGLGVGRGILSNGLLSVHNGRFFFGEYFGNQGRSNVNIYESMDNGQTWEVAYRFRPGSIRHVHALQEDPYTGRLWVCTGDHDHEAMIAWSDDGFRTINQIGTGSQVWRTTQLVFTENAVFWGTDTGSEDLSGIYCWDKVTMQLTRLHKTNGGILFGTKLSGNTMIFSSDREGFPNEKDNRTRLFVLKTTDKMSEIEFGTWKHRKRGYRFSFAMLRMQRNQGKKQLLVSVINQKEFQNGEFFMFNEEDLIMQNTD